ncbi:unnamed protein product [Medioppia subpectinata]|uniref:Uncharacterized protein n=1 Tax=Medioppia subpectinata TaxID=1979941 RepID=A0A7R9KQ70_9ACAR|nr:unnamed protein product [Medioppia subpectinata]CAG2107788.1 unnamed protein product [Medioppia subpectinata]
MSEEDRHPLCMPFEIPENDPVYGPVGKRCHDFKRSVAGHRPNCALGPRVHVNTLTAPIDANFVYGSTEAVALRLRAFKGGLYSMHSIHYNFLYYFTSYPILIYNAKQHLNTTIESLGLMRVWDRFRDYGLKPILPPEDENPDLDCTGRPEHLFCFIAGDIRVNEQIHLTVLHTFYVRDHNRMAVELGRLNPHWDDERIYQECRHIMAASVQHITLNEFLPLVVGEELVHRYNLTEEKDGYWNGYDPNVHTAPSQAFTTAAFRFGHTFIQGMVRRYNKYHEFVSEDNLRNLLRQPFVVYEPGTLDELALGLLNTPAQTYDPFITEEVSGHLFQEIHAAVGMDLPAINLARAREQGVPGYNIYREWCGLPRAETFEDLEPWLNNKTAYHYSQLYAHPDDIDLWSGGISERRLPGAMIGPTFACIVARNFANIRRGDRFWFENSGFPSAFTPEQLTQIKRSTQARIVCDNGDDIPTIQMWILRQAHPIFNPRVRCEDLPYMDLRYWQEDPVNGGYPFK